MKTKNFIILAILFSIYIVPSFANTPVVEGIGRVNDVESPHYMLWFYEIKDSDGSIIATGYGRSPQRTRNGGVEANISRYSQLGEALLDMGFDIASVPVTNFEPSRVFDVNKWNEQRESRYYLAREK